MKKILILLSCIISILVFLVIEKLPILSKNPIIDYPEEYNLLSSTDTLQAVVRNDTVFLFYNHPKK